MAVLCRTSRLFGLLRRAFDEHGVPVEILGLAGLLKQPEVVEVLAYARAVQDPTASVALARILLGRATASGFKDLALVARTATQKTKDLRAQYELSEDDAEAEPFLLAEALEQLDAIERLSEEGRERLTAFRDELRALRADARRPVGRVPGRGDPAHRDPRRARRRPGPRARGLARAGTSPRSSTRSTRSSRSRAS